MMCFFMVIQRDMLELLGKDFKCFRESVFTLPHPVSLQYKYYALSNFYFFHRYTVLPTTKFGKVWEGIIFVLAFITALTVSLQAAFVHTQPALWAINYLFDVIFFVDMSVQIN